MKRKIFTVVLTSTLVFPLTSFAGKYGPNSGSTVGRNAANKSSVGPLVNAADSGNEIDLRNTSIGVGGSIQKSELAFPALTADAVNQSNLKQNGLGVRVGLSSLNVSDGGLITRTGADIGLARYETDSKFTYTDLDGNTHAGNKVLDANMVLDGSGKTSSVDLTAGLKLGLGHKIAQVGPVFLGAVANVDPMVATRRLSTGQSTNSGMIVISPELILGAKLGTEEFPVVVTGSATTPLVTINDTAIKNDEYFAKDIALAYNLSANFNQYLKATGHFAPVGEGYAISGRLETNSAPGGTGIGIYAEGAKVEAEPLKADYIGGGVHAVWGNKPAQ